MRHPCYCIITTDSSRLLTLAMNNYSVSFEHWFNTLLDCIKWYTPLVTAEAALYNVLLEKRTVIDSPFLVQPHDIPP